MEEGGGIATSDNEPEQASGLLGAEESPANEDKKEAAKPDGPAQSAPAEAAAQPAAPAGARVSAPLWFWIVLAVGLAAIALIYWLWSWERLEVYKMLLTSFFPLAILILMVLGSIVFGLATPTEAAAVGALGGCVLAAAYRFAEHWRKKSTGDTTARSAIWTTARELGGIIRESSFLTAKTSAMVCWLFVGSSIFSASF